MNHNQIKLLKSRILQSCCLILKVHSNVELLLIGLPAMNPSRLTKQLESGTKFIRVVQS